MVVAKQGSQHKNYITSTGAPPCNAEFARLKHGIVLRQRLMSICRTSMLGALSARNFSEIKDGVRHTNARLITVAPIARDISSQKHS